MASIVRSECASAEVVAAVQHRIKISQKSRWPRHTNRPKYNERPCDFEERQERQIQSIWIKMAMKHMDMPCIRELLTKGYGENNRILSMAVQTLNPQVVQACRELRPEARTWYDVHVNSRTGPTRSMSDILADLRRAHEIIHSLYNESPRVLPILGCSISKFGLQCYTALHFINRQEELPVIADFMLWLRNFFMRERNQSVSLLNMLNNCITYRYPLEALDWVLEIFLENRAADGTWSDCGCRSVHVRQIRRQCLSRVKDPALHAQYDAWLTQHFP